MTITREQVADLQPGDVVSVSLTLHPGVVITGPITDDHGTLRCGLVVLRHPSGAEGAFLDRLTLVSRAPRRLYVNHPRTKPVPGDIVRDADDAADVRNWRYTWTDDRPWLGPPDEGRDLIFTMASRDEMPTRLRLLVDGDTGQSAGPDAAEGWAEGFEAAVEWAAHNPGPSGIPHDPPTNPYETGQVVP